MVKTKKSKIQLSFGESVPGIERIDEDLIIFERNSDILLSDYPVRVDLALVSLCTKGCVRTAINIHELEMSPNCLLIAMPDQILQQLARSPDFSGIFIGISHKLINEAVMGMNDMLSTILLLQENPLIKLNDEEAQLIHQYYSFLAERLRDKSHRYHGQLTRHLLSALFHEIFNIIVNNQKKGKEAKNRQDDLFERFMRLVHSHFILERTVAFYAKELGITPKYLSQTIKEASGKTAGEWIDLYVILEAKVLLRSSDENIQAIANRLHFPNQSFFGRYFKQHVGLSPKEYRKIQ